MMNHVKTSLFIFAALTAIVSIDAGSKKAGSTQRKTLASLDYLGAGYNILIGDPLAEGVDPGFATDVFSLGYTDNGCKQFCSADGKTQFPDDTDSRPIPTCTHDTNTKEVTGASSYKDMLSVGVKVNGGVGPVDFSASVGVTTAKEHYENNHQISVDVVSMCTKYTAEILPTAKTLSPSFIQEVNNLPDKLDQPAYNRFINQFGTHYVYKVLVGAMAIEHNLFDDQKWSDLQSKKINVEVGASVSFGEAHGGISATTDSEKSSSKEFQQTRTSSHTAYRGGKPPADANWVTWSQTATDDPVTLQISVNANYELLTPKYFPKLNAQSLAAKAKNLQDAVTVYCNGLKGCGAVPADRPPVLIEHPESAFRNIGAPSCSQGYKLLFCGLANSPGTTTTPADHYRYAVPKADGTGCKCHSDDGASCAIACSNILEGFEVVQSGFKVGASSATCSAGKVVIGCHIEATQSTPLADRWRAHYPNDAKTGCSCFSTAFDGGNCVATCASKITTSIQTAHGTGVIPVPCPAKTFALGCGIKPDGSENDVDTDDNSRTFRVSSSGACECKDNSGATCYAICASFYQ